MCWHQQMSRVRSWQHENFTFAVKSEKASPKVTFEEVFRVNVSFAESLQSEQHKAMRSGRAWWTHKGLEWPVRMEITGHARVGMVRRRCQRSQQLALAWGTAGWAAGCVQRGPPSGLHLGRMVLSEWRWVEMSTASAWKQMHFRIAVTGPMRWEKDRFPSTSGIPSSFEGLQSQQSAVVIVGAMISYELFWCKEPLVLVRNRMKFLGSNTDSAFASHDFCYHIFKIWIIIIIITVPGDAVPGKCLSHLMSNCKYLVYIKYYYEFPKITT